MSEVFKIIHPGKYFNDFISKKVRPDGRNFEEFRNLRLNVNVIETADASAAIKDGNSSVVCGIKLELAKPKAEEPNLGFIVTNVELPALCSPKYRPGPPSDDAQITSNLVNNILINSKCIDLTKLCIVPDKLAWVIYCDMICLNNDGSLVDACLVSLIAALKTVTLPSVEYDIEIEEITVNPQIKTSLEVQGIPVATSFCIYNSEVILTDPDAFEEEMCGSLGANLIVCWNGDQLCGVHKLGGNNSLPEEFQKKTLSIAKNRSKVIAEMINSCIKNDGNI